MSCDSEVRGGEEVNLDLIDSVLNMPSGEEKEGKH